MAVVIRSVAPLAGAWIEITGTTTIHASLLVAPLAGAWIEIDICKHYVYIFVSLPSRERGLKYFRALCHSLLLQSLPSRERGLK